MTEPSRIWEEMSRAVLWDVPWRTVFHRGEWFSGGYANLSSNCLDRHGSRLKSQTALHEFYRGRQRSWSYDRLYQEAGRGARWLWDNHFGPGSRIALSGPVTGDMVAAALGIARVGGTVVLLPEPESPEQFQRYLQQTETTLYLGDYPVGGGISALNWTTWRIAMERAQGLLDPISMPAGAVGFVVLGDRPDPYHFTGMGLLVEGLALTDRIPLLAESRHWTLVSRVYEVPHMLVWVLVQLARGRSLTLLPEGIPIEPRGIIPDGPWLIPASIYEDAPDDWLERSPSGRIIIGPLAPHVTTVEDSGTVSLWGPGQEGLPRWMTADEPLLDDPGPGSDLTAVSAEMSTVPPTVFSLSNPPAAVLAVPTRSERGNRLWVKSSREIADDTYQQLLQPFEQEGWIPIRVSQWPITREGHIDTRVLQQLADGDPLIDISRLRNVGVIPALVQSLALAPSVPN